MAQYERAGGGYNYNQQNIELDRLTQNDQQLGRQHDPNAILNECREIHKGIDAVEHNLVTIKTLQQRALDDPGFSQQSDTNSQLDSMNSEIMAMYRSLAARIKTLKQKAESSSPKNAPQLGKVDRKLKAAINQYQNVESDFRKKLQAQMARQYKIVRPNASDAEVREAVEDISNQQVFSQALLQSDRRGQSRQALSSVQNRHAAIQKIESQMMELAQLFHDMEALVVQQEDNVALTEQNGEQVQDNLGKGTEQINLGIKSARARNRKKWYCLGIVGQEINTLLPNISSDPLIPPPLLSLQLRITAEDATANWALNTGTITSLALPFGNSIRLDHHLTPGLVVKTDFDSLLAKLVITASTYPTSPCPPPPHQTSPQQFSCVTHRRYTPHFSLCAPDVVHPRPGIHNRLCWCPHLVLHTPPRRGR
ncbi:hypothetical protein VE03_09135 [Pseudogymnoascus sp. 23342-1-I1]|nr:hypothetical protein VE03_09135 [Pseudogymnoascus sp. 23342-1-I1]